MIPSSVYFTVSSDSFSSFQHPTTKPLHIAQHRHYILTYECLVCVGENCVYIKKRNSFVFPSVRSHWCSIRMYVSAVSVMPERKEWKNKNYMYIWGSHIFCVLCCISFTFSELCESFVYAGELDCIFFFGMMNPKSDVRWRSAEQWGKARKIIKQRRVEMKWNIKILFK